ncbi:hypothetical protein ACOMHN_049293 [Nucella lapillus]
MTKDDDTVTQEQTEATPTNVEEPIKTDPATEDTPITSEEPPIKSEDPTEATPPAAEDSPKVEVADEIQPEPNKAEDFFDMKPGKAETEAGGTSTETVAETSTAEGAGPESSQTTGANSDTTEGKDEADAVPAEEGDGDAPVQESAATTTTSAEQPAANEDTTTTTTPTTDAAASSDNAAGVDEKDAAASTEAPAEEAPEDTPTQEAPAEETQPETQDTPAEVTVIVTEAEAVAADGEPVPEDPATPEAPVEGGDSAQSEDVQDTPIPVSSPVQEKVQPEATAGSGTRPSTAAAYDYEDDFHSVISDKSDREVLTAATDTTEPASSSPAPEDPPAVAIQPPTPTTVDEVRAEAGKTVPVAAAAATFDGRSAAEERGENRGEDRSEIQADEGGENSRGQGQWKTEEEAMVESSVAAQGADREALKKVTEEKERLEVELDTLKGRYVSLQEGSKQQELEAGHLRERCQQLETRITELEAEIALLKREVEAGKLNEAKVKDLQECLAKLSDEDSKKEQRLQKIQADLQETQCRLTAAEHQGAATREASDLRGQQPPPQSKTCSVM